MKKQCANWAALGWAIFILLGQFAFIAVQAGYSTNDFTKEVEDKNSADAIQLAERACSGCNQVSGPLRELRLQHGYLSEEKTGRASERIMKDLTELFKSVSYKKGLLKIELINDDLYEWEVKLSIADKDSELHNDLVRMWGKDGEDHVVLRVKFNDNYPNEPPFVRIAYPFLIGKHVERGGTLCMHMLTRNGWNKRCTLESMFLSITLLLVEGKSRVDNLKTSDNLEGVYNEQAAREGFDHLVKAMNAVGWYQI